MGLIQIFRYAIEEQLNSECDQDHAHQAFDGDMPSFGEESKQERRLEDRDVPEAIHDQEEGHRYRQDLH